MPLCAWHTRIHTKASAVEEKISAPGAAHSWAGLGQDLLMSLGLSRGSHKFFSNGHLRQAAESV